MTDLTIRRTKSLPFNVEFDSKVRLGRTFPDNVPTAEHTLTTNEWHAFSGPPVEVVHARPDDSRFIAAATELEDLVGPGRLNVDEITLLGRPGAMNGYMRGQGNSGIDYTVRGAEVLRNKVPRPDLAKDAQRALTLSTSMVDEFAEVGAGKRALMFLQGAINIIPIHPGARP